MVCQVDRAALKSHFVISGVIELFALLVRHYK